MRQANDREVVVTENSITINGISIIQVINLNPARK
jgi:hypothetical protein